MEAVLFDDAVSPEEAQERENTKVMAPSLSPTSPRDGSRVTAVATTSCEACVFERRHKSAAPTAHAASCSRFSGSDEQQSPTPSISPFAYFEPCPPSRETAAFRIVPAPISVASPSAATRVASFSPGVASPRSAGRPRPVSPPPGASELSPPVREVCGEAEEEENELAASQDPSKRLALAPLVLARSRVRLSDERSRDGDWLGLPAWACPFDPSSTSWGAALYVVKSGDVTGTLRLDDGRRCTIFGRNPQNANLRKTQVLADVSPYILQHPSSSRLHASVFKAEGEEHVLYIVDLGSSNGTFVNNRRLEPFWPEPVRDRTTIRFAESSRVYIVRTFPTKSSCTLSMIDLPALAAATATPSTEDVESALNARRNSVVGLTLSEELERTYVDDSERQRSAGKLSTAPGSCPSNAKTEESSMEVIEPAAASASPKLTKLHGRVERRVSFSVAAPLVLDSPLVTSSSLAFSESALPTSTLMSMPTLNTTTASSKSSAEARGSGMQTTRPKAGNPLVATSALWPQEFSSSSSINGHGHPSALSNLQLDNGVTTVSDDLNELFEAQQHPSAAGDDGGEGSATASQQSLSDSRAAGHVSASSSPELATTQTLVSSSGAPLIPQRHRRGSQHAGTGLRGLGSRPHRSSSSNSLDGITESFSSFTPTPASSSFRSTPPLSIPMSTRRLEKVLEESTDAPVPKSDPFETFSPSSATTTTAGPPGLAQQRARGMGLRGGSDLSSSGDDGGSFFLGSPILRKRSFTDVLENSRQKRSCSESYE